MRFSIKVLLFAIAAVAVGCAALLNASDLWADILSATAVACLLVALIGAVACHGYRRAFWWGFAVVGWGYLLLMETMDGWSVSLITERLLDRLHGMVAAEQDITSEQYWEMLGIDPLEPLGGLGGGGLGGGGLVGGGLVGGGLGGGGLGGGGLGGGGTMTQVLPIRQFFLKIGHAICLLLFAFLGGLIGRYFHAGSSPEKVAD